MDDGNAKIDVDEKELKVLLELWNTKPGRYRKKQRPGIFGDGGGFLKLGYRWIAHLDTEYHGNGQDIGQHGRVTKTTLDNTYRHQRQGIGLWCSVRTRKAVCPRDYCLGTVK